MKRFTFLYLLILLFAHSTLVGQGLSSPERSRLFRKLTEVPSQMAKQEFEEALSSLRSGIPLLEDLVRSDPSMKQAYASALYLMGVCQIELEKYRDAQATFEEFVQNFPAHANAVKARLLLGEAYLYQEDWEGIIRAVSRVVEQDMIPASEKAFGHQLLAEAFYQLEMWGKAKPHLIWTFLNVRETEVRMSAASRIAVSLIRLREFDQLYQAMPRLHQTDAKYDIGLNLTLLEEGDDFMLEERPDLALLLFRMVVPYSELVKKLDERQTIAEQRLEAYHNAMASGMGGQSQRTRALERVLDELEAEREELADYPNYDLELRIRLGDVYYKLERWEEAIQLFLSVYERDPDAGLSERAMYSAYMTAFEADERIRAWDIAQRYMDAYPGGEYWDDVTLHATGLLISMERWFESEETVDRAIAESPNHVMKDNLLYMKGYSQFMQDKIQEAITTMQQVVERFPNSAFQIPCQYWVAMGHLFLENYPEARLGFATLIERAQAGVLRQDGYYRMAVAAYGEGDFAGAKSILDNFLSEYPDSHLASEAHAMTGDILASDGRLDEAIARYERAMDTAHRRPDGTLNMVQVDYAAFQLARTYELESRWQEIIDLFDQYQERFADQKANYTEATYWKGSALKQLDRGDEALQLFYDAIVTHGNRRDAYGIDFILRDLSGEINDIQGDQAAANDVKERLNQEIKRARDQDETTLLLRLQAMQFETTESDAARKLVKQVLMREENIQEASPFTLDVMGRIADAEGDTDMARKVYEYFLNTYEDSDLILHALVGLSENRIAEERYGEAIDMLRSITDRYPTLPQAADAYMRLGDVYRLVDEPEKAIEVYTLILTVKEWRGELWPRALLSIGDTHAEQNEYDKAFGFYQRVYLMYVGYEEYAAQAYFKSAQMLEELGKEAEAKKTLQEMLENETLAGQSVASDARLMILRLP